MRFDLGTAISDSRLSRLSRLGAALAALLASAMLIAPDARAEDWPVFRHDARRTAASTAVVPIDRPAPLFRTYLGGSLGVTQFMDMDVDGDGRFELVYVSGGRVVAKRGDNLAVWESDIVPVNTMWGAVDFDGDGTDEILLTRSWPAPSQLVVVSSVDGSVVWEMPAATTDWFGGIRVGDIDGDGKEDLYVGTGMCGTGVSGPNGTAFSFCEGGTCSYASARTLWNLTGGSGNCGSGGVLGDTDGDGDDELVISWEHPTVGVYSTATGAREGSLPSFSGGDYDRGATRLMLENLDDDPALEVVTWTNAFNAGSGARRVAVFDWTGSAYALQWELVGADRAADRVVMDGANSIGDLDGDGVMEIAVARYLGSTDTWTTTVRNAMTGVVEATLPGDLTLVGVTDLTGDGTRELLAKDGASLKAYQIAADGTATEHFSLAGRVRVWVNDVARRPHELNPTRVFTMQLDEDAPAELIVGEEDSDGNLVALHAYDADTSTPALLGTYRAPMGVSILVANEVGPMTRDYRQPVVATSDGYLLILDRAMVVTNRVVSAEFEEPGMRVGGFYTGAQGPRSTALVGAFSDGTSVLTPDSRGALVRLDASAASPVSAPVVQDQIFGARWASILDVDGSAPNELVVFEGTDLVVRNGGPGLTELGRATGAGLAGFRADPLLAAGPGGEARLVVTRYDASSRIQFASYDAGSLAERWASALTLPGWGKQNHGIHSVADLTGDSVDDVVSVVNAGLLLDGQNGSTRWSNGPFMAGADPIIASVDGDATPEVFFHGAWQSTRLVSNAGSTRWTRPATNTQVNAYGAQVDCAGAVSFVAGESGSPELLTIKGSDGSITTRRVLAEGMAYDVGSVPTGARTGITGNVTAVASLGTSGDPAVLVGSTDGYLYALDPCALTVRWSIDLRYPVGEPIVADLDGDGQDEIVVSVADGYLYGIGGAAYDAPVVRDIEPGAPGTDVDEVDTSDTLWASWDPVPGATSYIVSVFTEFGSEVRFPNAQDVGAVDVVEIPMLALAQGGTYFVAVQAVGPDGPGLEGRSDGVTVVDTLPPEATISVSPDPAWPPASIMPRLFGTCTDRVDLARIETSVETIDGSNIIPVDTRIVMGLAATSMAPWDGRIDSAEAPAGTYVARVTCTDSGDRTATATVMFDLDPTAEPMTPDGGMVDPDSGTMTMDDGGCGCRTTTPRTTGAPLGALGLLMVVTIARRMRRRR